jgi:hypothetical protein
VYVLRWFWWRINAGSEISAMIASSVFTLALLGFKLSYGGRLLIITFGSMAVWITVTFLTKPAPFNALAEFYRRTRPIGFWGSVRKWMRANGQITPKPEAMSIPLMGFVWGMALVFGLTLGIGYNLLLNPPLAIIGYAVALVGGIGLWKAGFLRTT